VYEKTFSKIEQGSCLLLHHMTRTVTLGFGEPTFLDSELPIAVRSASWQRFADG